MISLRRQLLIALLSTLCLTLLAAAYVSYRLAREEVDENFDYQLRQIALAQRHGDFTDAVAQREQEEDIDFVVQVFSADGNRIYLSDSGSRLPAPRRMGFYDVTVAGQAWRTYSDNQEGRVIQVAQPLSDREELAATAAIRAVEPFLVLLPVVVFMVWLIVGRGLASLTRLAVLVEGRSPEDLAPLPAQDTPREVLPLVHALNNLLARLGKSLASQRSFVADAAHELRTPLTALSLQAQLIERSRDDTERAKALSELKAGLQRATHVVSQLLDLARSEPGGDEKHFQTVNLADLAATVSSRYLALAEADGLDLGVAEESQAAVVLGEQRKLETLLANLVENAIRYTPRGGRIDIRTGTDANHAWLEVADNGPGIAEKDRERVFDRFYRQIGSNQSGTGLGLAIVQAIAHRHGASIVLANPPTGGLTVNVQFPRITAS